jgi:3-hydroxyacyl-CoA dehydrogenase/enoyl-CoA hydratase/3-hydroxybutyryl-CoA epimerase
MKTLSYEVDAQGIAIITLDNPDTPMNVVSPEFMDDMIAATDKVKNDNAVIGAVITSGKSAFMAGADLKYFLAEIDKGMTLEEGYAFSQRASVDMHRHMETCGKPFVAAINGLALGGGFELTLACHYRVVADNPKIALGLPEVTVGLLAGSGGTQRLPRIVGIENALPMIVQGKTLTPEQALKIGAVDQVVSAEQLLDAAKAILLNNPDAERAWDKKGYQPAEGSGLQNSKMAATYSMWVAGITEKMYRNYPAPIANLDCIYEGMLMPMDKALNYESKRFAQLIADPVAGNIIRTGFVNKGLANKLFRRPKGIEKAQFSKVAVLGAGLMGAGIAHVAAKRGMEVVLLDTNIEAAEKGKNYSEKIVNKQITRGRMKQEAADSLLARIHPTVDYNDLADCTLVIEAVFEDIAIKAEVTRKAEAVLPATAIYASNTSTLPITDLAKASGRPERFIGLHFFSPVERMPLIEVINGTQTSDETLAQALDFVGQMRMTPVLVNDSRGFYTSRVFQMFIHEGMKMLEEGVEPARIENVAKQAGFPIGPLELTDALTIELPWKIIQQSIEAEGDAYKLPSSYNVIKTMVVDEKRIGRRGGGGFYEYPKDGEKYLWPKLGELYPIAEQQPEADDMIKRFLYSQSLETARCYEEGVLTHPADADLGSVLGWGFPIYTGGTLSLIDTVGTAEFVAECEQLAVTYGERFTPSAWLKDRAAKGITFYPCE